MVSAGLGFCTAVTGSSEVRKVVDKLRQMADSFEVLARGGDVVVERGVPNKWTRRLGIGKQAVPDQAIDPRSVFKRRDFFPK